MGPHFGAPCFHHQGKAFRWARFEVFKAILREACSKIFKVPAGRMTGATRGVILSADENAGPSITFRRTPCIPANLRRDHALSADRPLNQRGGTAAVPSPRLEGSVALPDGRTLAYAEYGAAEGTPVLYFHGLPSSRREGALADRQARRLGLRIISVDRPGFGGSSFQSDRRIADWPGDISRLADTLSLPRFGVMGTSGGGPYVLACAASLPDRVTGAVLLCGLGRVAETSDTPAFRGFARFALGVARRAPVLLPAVCIPVAWGLHTPAVDFYFKHFAHGLGDLDSRALLDPLVRGALVAAFRESARGGHRGPCHDLRIAAHPWGFDPRDITVPVHFFHGDRDRVVPHSMSTELAGLIRGARVDILPGEGHYSLPVRHSREALSRLGALS